MSIPIEILRSMEVAYDDFLSALKNKDWKKAEEIIVNMVDYSLSVSREMREELEKAKAI